MDNFEDEEVFRIILFKKDFLEAEKCFLKSKTISDIFIRDSLIKMGIVCYARPFMGNTGIHKEVRKYKYPVKVVPDELMWLHEMFMDYRGNFIGHSNFNTLKPDITRPEKGAHENRFKYSFTDISFNHWYKTDEDYPEVDLLIDDAISLVKRLASDIPGFNDIYNKTTGSEYC
jgi:hypothetical protein